MVEVRSKSSCAAGGTASPVEFFDVTKRYGDVFAVRSINLAVHPGEFLTLLGPSGSGKTTLLMLLAGFESATSGEIRVDGKSLANVPAHRRNQGVVFQSYALFPHMTVYQNLEFPLDARGISRVTKEKMIDAALQRVRMAPFANRLPAQLSGGQQQRIALARSIVFDPPLILMDESLSALDRKLRSEMQFELKDLHRELGKTMVYVTHDQDEAMVLSDRIVVMDAGRIVQVGTPSEVYDRPASEFIAGFMGEANFFDGIVVQQVGKGPGVSIDEGTIVEAANANEFRVGERVRVMVRPEAIDLWSEDAIDANSAPAAPVAIRGNVDHVAFLGDSHRYRVRCGRQTVKVKVSRTLQNAVFAAGDAVLLALHPERIRLVAG
jgi:spermidine/putrescine ABC transporter ATP-binding subunit